MPPSPPTLSLLIVEPHDLCPCSVNAENKKEKRFNIKAQSLADGFFFQEKAARRITYSCVEPLRFQMRPPHWWRGTPRAGLCWNCHFWVCGHACNRSSYILHILQQHHCNHCVQFETFFLYCPFSKAHRLVLRPHICNSDKDPLQSSFVKRSQWSIKHVYAEKKNCFIL